MSLLMNRFILLNFLKNFLLICSGIGLFLTGFDCLFAGEIFVRSNVSQGLLLATVFLLLNYFADYKRLTSLGCAAGNPECWQRYFTREGTAELDFQLVSNFLQQDPSIFEIEEKDTLFSFKIRYSRFLPFLRGSVCIEGSLVKVSFVNSSFLHFGAISAIALYLFLGRMEKHLYPDLK